MISEECKGFKTALHGLGWKCASGLVRNVVGKRAELFVMEHKASIWSPTSHFPNENLAPGLTVISTGTAVPETAISRLQPEDEWKSLLKYDSSLF